LCSPRPESRSCRDSLRRPARPAPQPPGRSRQRSDGGGMRGAAQLVLPLQAREMIRRGGRAAEGARLESVYTATYRGFESHPLRQFVLDRTSPPKNAWGVQEGDASRPPGGAPEGADLKVRIERCAAMVGSYIVQSGRAGRAA